MSILDGMLTAANILRNRDKRKSTQCWTAAAIDCLMAAIIQEEINQEVIRTMLKGFKDYDGAKIFLSGGPIASPRILRRQQQLADKRSRTDRRARHTSKQ